MRTALIVIAVITYALAALVFVGSLLSRATDAGVLQMLILVLIGTNALAAIALIDALRNRP